MSQSANDNPAATQVSGGKVVAPAAKGAADDGGKKATVLGGDFKLLKKLGQGGMGAVYLAHQISLDRQCAVKVMAKELSAKPGFVERFLREARAMARIEHPNVVRCYQIGEDKGLHYVAMELIEGRSMQDWIDQLGKLTVGDAVLVTLLCADALRHAHSLNMVHRDIKPDNILVTHKGIVKVSDLGLAKATDEDMSMTQSGTGLGTPHYMPPEQARNAKHVDQRCDIYALGCTLYHFVSGKLPFSGESLLELITNKEKGQFTPARRSNPDVSERLDLIIDKAMAKDPRARYASCEELIKDLETLNLASEALSFISATDKVVVRRSGGAATATAGFNATRGPQSLPRPASSPSLPAADPAPTGRADGDAAWYIRYTSSGGETKVAKMTASQILQGLRSDKLDESTRVAVNAKGPFLPPAQVPVFEDETRKMLARHSAKAKGRDLKATYAELEKQYNRQKWWRLLARFREGTLGLVGLILWLAFVAALIGACAYGVYYAWTKLGSQFGLN